MAAWEMTLVFDYMQATERDSCVVELGDFDDEVA